MNDFTKEELQSLQYCMRQITIHIDGYVALYNKIQSMIDNYSKEDEELAEIRKEIETVYE